MRDLWTGLALVLVVEGILYALFPQGMKRVAARTILLPPQTLRGGGTAGRRDRRRDRLGVAAIEGAKRRERTWYIQLVCRAFLS